MQSIEPFCSSNYEAYLASLEQIPNCQNKREMTPDSINNEQENTEDILTFTTTTTNANKKQQVNIPINPKR